MDIYKSKAIEEQLLGKEIDGYEIISYINCGKSAAVFKAIKDGINYAIKIFDNEMVERFGHEIQLKRIEQEIGLKGHKINNLIQIKHGGVHIISGLSYHFLVMEYVEGKNLKQFINSEEYDQEFIVSTFNSLVLVAKDLLSLENPLVHRDIKPENIMVAENGKIVLMDLGVLKLIGAKSISDGEEKQFVGTLRYAPPEFLLREEVDTIECWNAVNLYQIGGVLHDLIQKKELFIERTPYTRLVLAIKEDPPVISKNGYSHDLIQLTRNLLSKDWKLRNQLVSDKAIRIFNEKLLSNESPLKSGIEELKSMSIGHQSALSEIAEISRSTKEKRDIRQGISNKLLPIVISSFKIFTENEIVKTYQHSKPFVLKDDLNRINEVQIANYLFKLSGDYSIGFSKPVIFWIRTENDEKQFVKMSIIGFLLSPSVRENNLQNPEQIIESIAKEKTRNQRVNFSFNLIEFFKGVIDFNDTETIEEQICTIIVGILKKSKSIMKPEVEQIIEFQRMVAEGKGRTYSRTTHSSGTHIIDNI